MGAKAKRTTYAEIMEDLDRVVSFTVVEDGYALEIAAECDGYFVRYLTKQQAQTLLDGLAALVAGMKS